MQNRETQRLLHTKQNKGKTGVGLPSDREGANGDIWVRQINGKTALCAKYNNTWRKFTEDTNTISDGIIGISLSENGHAKFGGGLLIQWGQETSTATTEVVTFPIPFPNACLNVVCTDYDDADVSGIGGVTGLNTLPSESKTSISFSCYNAVNSFFWQAIGY